MFACSRFFQVKTEYVKRKGIIVVDGQELAAVSALGDGSTLDVEGKLYVGGLPLDYVPKNLGNVRTGCGTSLTSCSTRMSALRQTI